VKHGGMFVRAIVIEREGGFFIALRDRLSKRPDYVLPLKFDSRENALEHCSRCADLANEALSAYARRVATPGWFSDS